MLWIQEPIHKCRFGWSQPVRVCCSCNWAKIRPAITGSHHSWLAVGYGWLSKYEQSVVVSQPTMSGWLWLAYITCVSPRYKDFWFWPQEKWGKCKSWGQGEEEKETAGKPAGQLLHTQPFSLSAGMAYNAYCSGWSQSFYQVEHFGPVVGQLSDCCRG